MSELPPDADPWRPIEGDMADLTAFAEGSLTPERRAELEARIARSPELAAALAEKQRGMALVSGAMHVRAPGHLLERVEHLAGRRTVSQMVGARPWREFAAGGRASARRHRAALAAGAVLASAVAALVALVLAGTSAKGLRPYLALAARPPTMAAPAESRAHRDHLAIAVGAVAFPYWEDSFGWRALGARADRVEGRPVTTVFYGDSQGARISYSILAGSRPTARALAADAQRVSVVERDGVAYQIETAGGARAVTWLRSGHRCVLSGHGVSPDALLRLASWGEHGGMGAA